MLESPPIALHRIFRCSCSSRAQRQERTERSNQISQIYPFSKALHPLEPNPDVQRKKRRGWRTRRRAYEVPRATHFASPALLVIFAALTSRGSRSVRARSRSCGSIRFACVAERRTSPSRSFHGDKAKEREQIEEEKERSTSKGGTGAGDLIG